MRLLVIFIDTVVENTNFLSISILSMSKNLSVETQEKEKEKKTFEGSSLGIP